MYLSLGGLLLLVFFLPAIGAWLLAKGIDVEQRAEKRSVVKTIGGFAVLAGSACSLITIFQGLHLMNIDYKLFDTKAAMEMTTTHRRSWIIVFPLQFLPQFLGFGYALYLWEIKDVIIYSWGVARKYFS